METKNIMIVGVGGQGSLLASKLLGHPCAWAAACVNRCAHLVPSRAPRRRAEP